MTPPRTPLGMRTARGTAADVAAAAEPDAVQDLGAGSAARISQQLYEVLRISGDPDETSSPPRAMTPVDDTTVFDQSAD